MSEVGDDGWVSELLHAPNMSLAQINLESSPFFLLLTIHTMIT